MQALLVYGAGLGGVFPAAGGFAGGMFEEAACAFRYAFKLVMTWSKFVSPARLRKANPSPRIFNESGYLLTSRYS